MNVVFNEDKSLKKKDASPFKYNIARKMALAMLKKEKPIKKSQNIKRLKAALDDKYRAEIMNR